MGARRPGQQAAHAGPATLGRRIAGPVVTFAGVAAAFAYVGSVDPNEPGHYPVCPLYGVTGVLCPGCGGLRSAHAFVHGDLATALGANAVAVAGYLVFAVVWVIWLVHAVRGGRSGHGSAPRGVVRRRPGVDLRRGAEPAVRVRAGP
ncbi:DUF2752 domain-containing protein [Streptomyces zhihengii]